MGYGLDATVGVNFQNSFGLNRRNNEKQQEKYRNNTKGCINFPFFHNLLSFQFVNVLAYTARCDVPLKTWSSLRAVGPTGRKLNQIRDYELCH